MRPRESSALRRGRGRRLCHNCLFVVLSSVFVTCFFCGSYLDSEALSNHPTPKSLGVAMRSLTDLGFMGVRSVGVAPHLQATGGVTGSVLSTAGAAPGRLRLSMSRICPSVVFVEAQYNRRDSGQTVPCPRQPSCGAEFVGDPFLYVE
ncbi:hypothetical protein SprV_0702280400 [Sparganum proliferum]